MLATAALLASGLFAPANATLEGRYVEARTADVFTGPCFSNSEVYLSGDQAVLAWQVTRGSFRGVDLSGLSVAAAVRATTTLGEDQPELARSVLIVDQKATPEQRDALIAFARSMAGKRLDRTAAVKSALISLVLEDDMATDATDHAHAGHTMPKAPMSRLWVPGIAEISARPLDPKDIHCGNEEVAYAPLSRDVAVQPAFVLANVYRGGDLGGTWSDAQSRGCFAGTFRTTP